MDLRKRTDDALVRLYQTGSNEAFEVLLARHGASVLNYIYSLVRDEDVAKDLFQDTFFKAIVSMRQNKYVCNGKFLPWINRIAHNAIMDYLGKVRQQDILSEQEMASCLAHDSQWSEKSIEDMLLNEQVLKDVVRLVRYLSAQQQEVVRMRFFEGLSFGEIADKTHVSVNTALGRMRYALINLRRIACEHDICLQLR